MRSRQVVIVQVLAIMISGCTNTLPGSVTCENVRSLQLGMSREEVEAAIGSPQQYAPAPADLRKIGPGGEIWSYETRSGVGGVAFELDFDATKLVRVHMHERYLWESDSSRTVYEISAAGRREEPDFAEIMNCSA
jgi:hypothetical protein